MLHQFADNVLHNLFKPLLLFFYAGFLIPLLRVKLEFPKPLYQSLTIYLLLAIGWHGGEELAALSAGSLGHALGFMAVGFATNLAIGFAAFLALRSFTRLRAVDAATVAGYYGSDSAGTFVTCLGVLTAAGIGHAAYMPVMLAVMEIPGCLVALFLVSRMRDRGLDARGYMPSEREAMAPPKVRMTEDGWESIDEEDDIVVEEGELVGAGAGGGHGNGHGNGHGAARPGRHGNGHHWQADRGHDQFPHHRDGPKHGQSGSPPQDLTLEELEPPAPRPARRQGFLSPEVLHEVFFNPGIFLLFAGIAIGFISRLQGEKVTAADDPLFVNLFQGVLCLFLLEMGMTASQRLKDLRSAGWRYVAFALVAPNAFATLGMLVAVAYGRLSGAPMEVGTLVLFAVLCGAASYIAVPAVQRLAIPEASPTLPLAASLGVTFSYNVTIGIPLYMMIAQLITGQSA